MADTNVFNRYIYVVNNTKKDIRKIPVNFTSENNIGFLEAMSGLVNAVKVGWNILTKYSWETSDSIEFLKDENCNLTVYQEQGYILN